MLQLQERETGVEEANATVVAAKDQVEKLEQQYKDTERDNEACLEANKDVQKREQVDAALLSARSHPCCHQHSLPPVAAAVLLLFVAMVIRQQSFLLLLLLLSPHHSWHCCCCCPCHPNPAPASALSITLLLLLLLVRSSTGAAFAAIHLRSCCYFARSNLQLCLALLASMLKVWACYLCCR